MQLSKPTKARSRLKRQSAKTLKLDDFLKVPSIRLSKVSADQVLAWIESHRVQLLSVLISSLLLLLLLTKVSPSKVANFGLAESYLPLLVLVGVLTAAVASFRCNRRWTVYCSLGVVLVLFSHLHRLIVPSNYWLVLLTLLGSMELVVLLAKKR